jgi:hypothetical protein
VRHPQISGAERFAFHADLVIEVPFSVSQDMAGRDAHSGERKLALVMDNRDYPSNDFVNLLRLSNIDCTGMR